MGEGLKADEARMLHSSSQVQGCGWGSCPTLPYLIGMLAVGIVLSCHMPSGPYKVTQEN